MLDIIKRCGLNSNHIKIIAMLSMFIDHMGYLLFDDMLILRIIGRLSFPMFAFMISEGCFYTKDIKKYFLRITVLGAVCQVGFVLFANGQNVNTLLTFSMSIVLIFLYQKVFETKEYKWKYAFVLGILTFFLICEVIPVFIPEKEYVIDYGFSGVLLPLVYYIPNKKYYKLLCSIPLLLVMCFMFQKYQFWSIAALIVLLFYNGNKGKYSLKFLFYIFYPAHFILLYLINILIYL